MTDDNEVNKDESIQHRLMRSASGGEQLVLKRAVTNNHSIIDHV
jgi:hypothetical protein